MTVRKAVLLAAALGLLALPALPAAAQCAMCKAVLEGAVEGQRVVRGLNHGILLMMAAPYVLVGGFVAVAFRSRLVAALGRLRLGRFRRSPAGA
jgi:hypothetical protein